jgi:hypothetical protein
MLVVSINGQKVSQLVDASLDIIRYSEDEADGIIKINDSSFGTYNKERAREIFAEIIENCKVNKTFYQLPIE